MVIGVKGLPRKPGPRDQKSENNQKLVCIQRSLVHSFDKGEIGILLRYGTTERWIGLKQELIIGQQILRNPKLFK